MALTPGSTSNSGTSVLYGQPSGSWSHTTLAGENSLWVHVSLHNALVTGITFNSVAMTLAATKTTGTYTSCWYYLVNPDIGTYNITVSEDADGYGAAGGIAFKGTDTDSPLGVTGTANGSGTNPTKTVTTTVDNSYVMQGCYGSGEGTTNTITTGSGETDIYKINNQGNKAAIQASYKSTTTAGSYTMSTTFSVSCVWAIAVIEVKPGAPEGNSTNMFLVF